MPSSPTTRPGKTMYNLLSDNWPTTGVEKHILKSNVHIQEIDYREDPDHPLNDTVFICISRSSGPAMTSQQQDTLFICPISVDVVYWCSSKTNEAIIAAKDKHWDAMQQVKKILQNSALIPSDWSFMKVQSSIPMNIEPPVPEVLYERISVDVQYDWSVT